MPSSLRHVARMLKEEPRARVFFLAVGQSSLGTGAAYVALLLVAYDRFESAWAIGLILLADVLPAMLLGPLFGAAADRWSRRWCTVVADVLRAVAFAGIFLVEGFVPTFLFSLLAGVGTGLFTPAALASLPSLVERPRLPAATSLYGALLDLGFTAGPALGALALLTGGPETILAANAVTFAASAILLAGLDFGRVAAAVDGESPSLLAQAREGINSLKQFAGLRLLLFASAGALLFAAIFNVGELLLATEELGAGEAGFSILVAVFGVGFIGGSLSGAAGGDTQLLKRRYLLGGFLMGIGSIAAGASPVLLTAVIALAGAGYGNGLLLTYERLLIQSLVPDDLSGRIFGVKDSLSAWAFALGFAVGPPLYELLGTRLAIVIAGCGGLLMSVCSVLGLRGTWTAQRAPALVFTRSTRLVRSLGAGTPPQLPRADYSSFFVDR